MAPEAPEVAGKLKRMYPDDPDMHVSHEAIYAHIYAHPRGGLRTELIKLLRKHRKKRMPRARGKDRRGQLHDITPISERPKDAHQFYGGPTLSFSGSGMFNALSVFVITRCAICNRSNSKEEPQSLRLPQAFP